jgi:hypothetical protein
MPLINYAPLRQHDGSVYDDIAAHCTRPNRGDGRYTDAHETSHFVSSEIRNQHSGRKNGFYILKDRAYVVDHPPITIRDIGRYVPSSLRGMRYDLYFVQQLKYWNEEPLYIAEELNCYTMGGSCALDDREAGRSLERTDAVAGALEFSVYTAALVMCVEQQAKAYWDATDDFHEAMKYLIRQGLLTYYAGRDQPEWQSQISQQFWTAYSATSDGHRFQAYIRSYVDAGGDFWCQ